MYCVSCTIVCLQLQSYERRGKEIKSAKEAKQWQLITPEMMSDEELVGEEYTRHPPTERSISGTLQLRTKFQTLCYKSVVFVEFH